ncbi:hypothetical protein [Rhodanobacter denitrificans]|nr:hypothetical protein [Rhodanobacter denitrificans]
MKFVHEDNADKEGNYLHLRRYGLTRPFNWIIDRDRDIFLAGISSMMPERDDEYLLKWKKMYIKVFTKRRWDASDRDECQITALELPRSLGEIFPEMFTVLKEAFIFWGFKKVTLLDDARIYVYDRD